MIEVKKLIKTFNLGDTIAVNDISFKIKTGQIACLIGTSGCGKTTTMKMINRIVKPTSGHVLIDGQSSDTVDDITWRRKIGYVVQKAGLFPHLNIKENISLLSKVLHRSEKFIDDKVRYLLELVNLNPDELMLRYPRELSGGQQQRVGIARSLMEDPPVLLMDEPFGALDPITRNAVHAELLSINQKLNKTILIVTHDISEAFKLADIIIVMDHGKIVQIDAPRDIKENPKSAFIKEFIE